MTSKELEQAVKLVLDAGLSTGHADTYLDLVGELIGEIRILQNALEEERLFLRGPRK